MDESYYELYQLKSGVQFSDRQFRPYRYLQEHGVDVRVDDYDLVLRGDVRENENVKMLRVRLEQELSGCEPASADGLGSDTDRKTGSLCINVGDVIAVTKRSLTTAYYVDPTKLILLPAFFHQSASGTLITIDVDNFPLDGRKGSWMTVDTLRVDGKNLFLMKSCDYGCDAPYVIVDEQGKELAADRNGFTDETIEQVRVSLKELEARQAASVIDASDKKPKLEIWQQYFENGEYLRAAEISEEQNYNMIDGTANNRAAKRSIIERLQEKQGRVDRSAAQLQSIDRDHIEDAERARK